MAQHDAIIIGAGIAGAAIAYHLGKAGRDVIVLEADTIAGAASGNPRGLFKPWLSLGDNPMRRFYTAAFHYALPLLEALKVPVTYQGILQFPKTEMDADRFRRAMTEAGFDEDDLQYLRAPRASEKMGTTVLKDCLVWQRGVVISPPEWVAALLGTTPVYEHHPVTAMTREGDGWRCIAGGRDFTARHIFVATGYNEYLLPSLRDKLRPRVGQLLLLPADALPRVNAASAFGHYWIPSSHDDTAHIVGATYGHDDSPVITDEAHRDNLSAITNLHDTLPELAEAAQKISLADCTGRAAVRATTANHLPLWGQTDEGIYYLTGLGSRGMLSAPYAAAQLCQGLVH
jgi:tRNA 5-methylaminomethyl-2-thiouridine biosynthesis bifunctional protein